MIIVYLFNIIVNSILIVNAIYYYYHCYLIIAVSNYTLSGTIRICS